MSSKFSRKLTALALSVVMALGIGTTAWAASIAPANNVIGDGGGTDVVNTNGNTLVHWRDGLPNSDVLKAEQTNGDGLNGTGYTVVTYGSDNRLKSAVKYQADGTTKSYAHTSLPTYLDVRAITAGRNYLNLAQVPNFLVAGFNLDDGMYAISVNTGANSPIAATTDTNESRNDLVQVLVGSGTKFYALGGYAGKPLGVMKAAQATLAPIAAATWNAGTNIFAVSELNIANQDGQYWLPIRGIAQALGIYVQWNANGDTAYYFPPVPYNIFSTADVTLKSVLTGAWTWAPVLGTGNDSTITGGTLGTPVVSGNTVTGADWLGTFEAANDLHAGYKCFTIAPAAAKVVVLHAGDTLPTAAIHGGGKTIVAYSLDGGNTVYQLASGGGHVIKLAAGQKLHLLYN